MAEMTRSLQSATRSNPKWFTAQAVLFVVMVALTLAGSYVIGTTNYGIFVIAGILALMVAARVMTSPALGLYLLVVFVFLNLSDIMKQSFGIPSMIRPLVG